MEVMDDIAPSAIQMPDAGHFALWLIDALFDLCAGVFVGEDLPPALRNMRRLNTKLPGDLLQRGIAAYVPAAPCKAPTRSRVQRARAGVQRDCDAAVAPSSLQYCCWHYPQRNDCSRRATRLCTFATRVCRRPRRRVSDDRVVRWATNFTA